jgi:hypothetical protein
MQNAYDGIVIEKELLNSIFIYHKHSHINVDEKRLEKKMQKNDSCIRVIEL